MAYPFYAALRSHYSHDYITFVCPKTLMDLEDHRWCNEKILYDPKVALEKKYDIGINLTASISSAYYLFKNKIPVRIGYAETGAELFLTSHLRWQGRESGMHKSKLFLNLLEWLTAIPVSSQPFFHSNQQQKENYIVIAPGASIELREWPFYRALCQKIDKVYPNLSIFIVGTDAKWKDISGKNITNQIGKTSLNALVALCSKARLVVANDSGVAHIACSLAQAKTIILFGPGDPQYISPLDEGAVVLREKSLLCSPCEKPYCRAPFGYKACLNKLSLDLVFDTIQTLL